MALRLLSVILLIAVNQAVSVISATDETLRFKAMGVSSIDAQWDTFKEVHGKQKPFLISTIPVLKLWVFSQTFTSVILYGSLSATLFVKIYSQKHIL